MHACMNGKIFLKLARNCMHICMEIMRREVILITLLFGLVLIAEARNIQRAFREGRGDHDHDHQEVWFHTKGIGVLLGHVSKFEGIDHVIEVDSKREVPSGPDPQHHGLAPPFP